MSKTTLQLRRGSSADNATFTGAAGEVIVNTTTNSLVVHDGTTVGGFGQAPLASPAFTGIPTAPTATAGTNSLQLATTAFVATAVANASPTLTTTAVTEGTNQYFTQARARSSVSATGSIAYNSGTGVFSYTAPTVLSAFTNDVGFLTSATILNALSVNSTPSGALTYNSATGVFTFTQAVNSVNGLTGTITLTTSNITEGTNKYATTTNVQTALAGGGVTNSMLANSTITVNGSTLTLGGTSTITAAAGTLTGSTLNASVTGSSLTSVGTITSGTWNGTAIANSYLVNTTIQLNGVTLTLGDTGKTIKASTTNSLTIGTGLSGSSFDGSSAVTIALATGYGDTQNPYASKTAKYVLAAPNSTSGAPTFRLLVASDIPTLNQDTTGNAGTVTNGVYTTGSYANPTWLTSLAYSKLTGAPTNVSTFTNDAAYITTGSLSISTNSPGTESLSYSAGVFTFTPYSLPIATSSRLGGVKAGTGVTIAADGTISSTGGAGGTSPTSASFDLWASILIMGS